MTCVIFSLLPSWHQRPIDNGLRDKRNNRSNIQAQLMTVNRQPVESLIGRLQVAVRHTECLTCDWFVGFRRNCRSTSSFTLCWLCGADTSEWRAFGT